MTRRVTRYTPHFYPLAFHVSSNRESGQTLRTGEMRNSGDGAKERGRVCSWIEIRELIVNEPRQRVREETNRTNGRTELFDRAEWLFRDATKLRCFSMLTMDVRVVDLGMEIRNCFAICTL